MATEYKQLRLRSTDLESLGIQVSFVNYDDAAINDECRANAELIKKTFFPDPPKYDKLGPGEELWDADANCDHEIIYPRGGGIKCHKCGGWFCY